jgi:hypothetical protein
VVASASALSGSFGEVISILSTSGLAEWGRLSANEPRASQDDPLQSLVSVGS